MPYSSSSFSFFQIVVDECLRCVGEGNSDIYAIGDCAYLQSSPLPGTAQVSISHAAHCSFIQAGRGPCALHHWIQSSMEAILACHPAVSTKSLAGWQFPIYYDVCHTAPIVESKGHVHFSTWLFKSAHITFGSCNWWYNPMQFVPWISTLTGFADLRATAPISQMFGEHDVTVLSFQCTWFFSWQRHGCYG